MKSAAQLVEAANRVIATGMVPVTQDDRDQMAIALFIQGYPSGRAAHMAYVELGDNDGALQMLARHRLAVEELMA